MHQVQIASMNYVRNVHEYLGHEPDAWIVARRLGLEVVMGDTSELNGNVITLARDDYYGRRAQRVLRHEIAHYLLQLSGCEDQILWLQGSHEEALPTLENLCYHASLILQIPKPLLWQAHAELGNTPQAIVRIAELSGASVVDALHRWVYSEVGAKRAAWIVRNGLVIEAASANLWLPFWRYSEVNEYELPNVQLHSLDRRETLGMVLGGI